MRRSVGFFLKALAFAFFLHVGFSLSSDAGVVLDGAWNLFNGQTVYTDFFSFGTPLSYYFIAGGFFIFGPSYFIALFFSLVLMVVASISLQIIVEYLGGGRKTALCASFFWIFIASISYTPISYNSHSSFLVLILTALFFLWLDRGEKKLIVSCGILSMVTIYTLQPKGIAIFFYFFVLLFFFIYKSKKSFYDILFFIISSGATLLIFLFIWGLKPWESLFTISEGYHRIVDVSPWPVILFCLAFIAVSAGVIFLTQSSKYAFIISALQIVLILSLWYHLDIYHIASVAFPTVILASIFLEKALFQIPKQYKLAFERIGFSLFLLAVGIFTIQNYNTYKKNVFFLSHLKTEVVHHEIFVSPFAPHLYFFLNKRNEYFSSNLIETQTPKIHYEKVLKKLMEVKPHIVITNYSMVLKYGHTAQNIVDQYIAQNYQISKQIGNVEVWRAMP